MTAWINLAEDWDFDVHPTVYDGRLVMACARFDNRDAIIGWRFPPAPPAQQYGFRLRTWLHAQREAQARAFGFLACFVAPHPEPF